MPDKNFAGKYRIDGILGEGGMGVVYKGYDPLIARVVAIKTIRANLLEGQSGQELLKRFRHEAQAAGRLTHPNIVAIYEYEECGKEGYPYFIMEYVEGKELKDYLKMGVRFTFDQSLHIIEQVLQALGYAHAHGIIHRDIKPANVILLDDKNVKIADFGIAKLDDMDFTQTGKVIGTPSYMSPEQCKGLHVDGRSDLYSTALLLYELLTGKKATAVSHQGGFAQIMKGFSPDKPDTSDPKTIHVFNTLIKKALAEEQDQRFQSAEEFLKEIKKLRAQHSAHTQKPPYWVFAGLLVGAVFVVSGVLLFESNSQTEVPAPPSENTGTPSSESNSVSSGPKPIVTVTTASKELTADEKNKIDKLLTVARTHRLVGRLITPTGSNAYYSYKMVLAIDSQNTEALDGIKAIEKEIVSKIKGYQERGNVEQANQLATVGQRLYPNNQELQLLATQ
ncbi:serine/threonine protein kinase [Alkalimarinus coralli]|uniref:serine/threonine protein kinase n=1 Tax=Alkalimarinus coralli TaxID=2935863 RepID=UPI00202B1C1C|nr:serine/threonine-protein kinase [Alkalimarinus coralli]